MTSTRARALGAAVEILGTQGIHALSHARVDRTAGLPKGSASNHFRTRAALLGGVVERLEADDRADWEAHHGGTPPSADALTEALARMVELAAGPLRVRTTARFALFLESAHDPGIAAALAPGRRRVLSWAAEALTALDAPDPPTAAAALCATVDGMTLHRLTVAADGGDPRPQLRGAVLAHLG